MLTGTSTGLLFGLLVGVFYHATLGAPPKLFHIFAIFGFVGGALIAVCVAKRLHPKNNVGKLLAIGGATLGALLVMFIIVYAFITRGFFITTVPIPAYCDGVYSEEPAYTMPDGTPGVLVAQDADVTIAAKIDAKDESDVYVVRRADTKIIWQNHFKDDTIAVAFDDAYAYIFNDALGNWVNKETGREDMDRILSIDTYGQNTNNFETTGIFSIWHKDGSVQSLRILTFSGIIKGCAVDGYNKKVRDI